MSLQTYTYWGLNLTANEPWPALEPFRSQAATPVDVRLETARRPLPSSVTEVAISPEQVQFQVAGVGRYTVRAGQTIEIVPEPDAPPAALELFLFGSAWGALCYQRNLLPLHASVVQWGTSAVAFCGPSGAGKSTLVARLVAQGGSRLISDDLCRCDPDAEPAPRVWPSLRRLKLWRETLLALGRPPQGLTQDLPSEDKFHWPVLEGGAADPAPLRAIYLLEWGPLERERLHGVRALRQFMPAATYRADLLERLGRLAAYWQTCALLVRRVPVYRLSRPRDWASLDAVDSLLDLG